MDYFIERLQKINEIELPVNQLGLPEYYSIVSVELSSVIEELIMFRDGYIKCANENI